MSYFDDENLRKPQYVKPPLSTKSLVVHVLLATVVVALLLAGLVVIAFGIFFVIAMSSYGSSK